MQSPVNLESLLQMAHQHGLDSCEPDHEVGDLQDILREAWSIMTDEQKDKLIQSHACQNLIELNDI